jgi:hypothetical protein
METFPVTGAFSPESISRIQATFDSIVSSPWFHDTEDARQDCSDLVMRTYRLQLPDDPHRRCVEVARSRFGRSPQ